jgi:hypothetical protein
MYKIEDTKKVIDSYKNGTYGVEDTPYRDYFVEGFNDIEFDNIFDENDKLQFHIIKYNENYLIGFDYKYYDWGYLSNLTENNFKEEELMQNFNSYDYNKKLLENFKENEIEDVIKYLSCEDCIVWLYAKQENLDKMITKLKDFLIENKIITGVKDND